MHSKQVKLINETGLHARPAAEFSRVASEFMADVFVEKVDGKSSPVNAKLVVNIVALHIEKGMEIKISAEGLDEMQAVETLVALVNRGFDGN